MDELLAVYNGDVMSVLSWQAVGHEVRDGSRDQIMKNMHGFYPPGQLFFIMICIWKEILESLFEQYIFSEHFNVINIHVLIMHGTKHKDRQTLFDTQGTLSSLYWCFATSKEGEDIGISKAWQE